MELSPKFCTALLGTLLIRWGDYGGYCAKYPVHDKASYSAKVFPSEIAAHSARGEFVLALSDPMTYGTSRDISSCEPPVHNSSTYLGARARTVIYMLQQQRALPFYSLESTS